MKDSNWRKGVENQALWPLLRLIILFCKTLFICRSQNISRGGNYHYSYFTDGEAKAQKGAMICPWSHRWSEKAGNTTQATQVQGSIHWALYGFLTLRDITNDNACGITVAPCKDNADTGGRVPSIEPIALFSAAPASSLTFPLLCRSPSMPLIWSEPKGIC